MRWVWGFGCAALVGWVLFLASPFLALYRLAEAVEARDAASLARRVNLSALRASLLEQLIDEYLKGAAVDPGQRRAAAAAGAALADPLVAQLATPEALLDLFEDGWPEAVAGSRPAEESGPGVGAGLASFGQAARLYAASQTRGFRKILIPVPPDRPRGEAFTLLLRFDGTAWPLTGIDLPDALRRRLVRIAPRPTG